VGQTTEKEQNMIDIHIGVSDIKRWRKSLALFVAGCVGLWLAYQVRDIWLPLLISLLIAMVLDPLVDKMESRGRSRLKSALLIYLAFFVFMVGTLVLAVPPLISQTTTITNSIAGILPTDMDTGNPNEMRVRLEKVMKKVHAEPWVEATVVRASSQISQAFNSATAWLGRVAQTALGNLLWIAIIPLVSFYALKDLHLIYARLLMLIPRDQRSNAQDIINKISVIFIRYLRGLVIVCALNAIATAAVLWLFGVPNPLGLGGISGALYTIPYLGPGLTVLLIAGVSFMAHKATLVIMITIIVLHSLIFDQLITPRVLGQHVGLHPILSIVALLVGGSLLGILGMILAVPLAAIVQMMVMTLFPKMAAPIDVPSGEQLHHQVEGPSAYQSDGDQLMQTIDVHQTIITAVDTAEDKEAAINEATAAAGITHTEAAQASALAPLAQNDVRTEVESQRAVELAATMAQNPPARTHGLTG
jgi:predicted PurR-regulated permease PerM